MDEKELRALEFEALIAEAQAISCEIQGMKYENEQRIILGQSMAYQEDMFIIKAEELREIAQNLRGLSRR